MNKKLIRKMQTASGGPIFPWLLNTEWADNWKFRTTPASRSKVLSGKGVETDKQYTERRKKETIKRTWRSDAADIAHGIGEGVLALHPYTAIPYYGAKVGLDFLNGTYGWHTALNASIPLFHLAPAPASVSTVVNNTLEDAANAGSKTARNWRIAREINDLVKNNTPVIYTPNPNTIFRANVFKGGDIKDPYSMFLTTDSKYASNYGKVTPYIFESNSIAKAREPMMGSRDPVTMDMFIYNNTKSNPEANAIIGHDKVTGEFAPSNGIEVYSMSPRNLFKINQKESPTSLKFFERKPSKITEAERAGVPKGERNNINNSGNLEKTVNNIILENRHWLPKETGRFAQKHSSIGSSYRKQYEKLWGKENTDRLTDDLLGKLVLIRNHLIETNIPLKGDFVYVVDGQAQAYRNGQEIGYLSNSYIDNGRALHPEMVKKQGINNAGVSELLYNGTILAENRPIISGSKLLMPEVTTHVWNKYPTRKLISMEGVHAWPLRTAQERGIKLNYEKNWHTLPEFSKLHQLAINENIRTNLTGLPIYKLSEPSYLPMVKNARIFDISLLRDGYINLDFTPGFAYKQGGKMNILEFLKNGSGIHIKEKNKGSFTRWCDGNVTEECIRRGKASSNPKIRKKATFADNARHFKHKFGGTVKKHQAFVPGASITDSRPEAYWEIKKKKKRLEKKLLGGYFNPNAMGGIFGETMLRKLYEQELLRLKELMKQLKAQLEALQIQQEADRTSGLINTIGNIGLNFLANKALSKNGVPNSLILQ